MHRLADPPAGLDRDLFHRLSDVRPCRQLTAEHVLAARPAVGSREEERPFSWQGNPEDERQSLRRGQATDPERGPRVPDLVHVGEPMTRRPLRDRGSEGAEPSTVGSEGAKPSTGPPQR